MSEPDWLHASGAAMWALVERHTGRVGYERGVKAEGLSRAEPVIDCSGWVALLLSVGMKTANSMADPAVFSVNDIEAVYTWSDRMIEKLEQRSSFVLAGDQITLESLPPYATIGLQQGGGAWAANHPRPRGITHVVQLVQRPLDGARFVSEAQALVEPNGLRLTPLADWIDRARRDLRDDVAWAVNAFAPRRQGVSQFKS